MAIKFNIEKHAVAGASKLLATNGGKHIYNIQLSEDTDNGAIIGRGDYVSLDLYKDAEATTFTGVIREQAANGNYYVEVLTAENALLVYQVPLIYEEYSKKFTQESNFYNEAGDIIRGYELAVGDIFELSEEGFDGIPTVGANVSVSAKKVSITE